MPWDIEDQDQFNEDKTGLLPEKNNNANRKYHTGLIWKSRTNTIEENAQLTELYRNLDERSLPASYDSRALGIVTPVRDQKECGSCVAFATAVLLETGLRKAGVKLAGLDYSEQQMVDCGYVKSGDGAKGN